MGLLLLFGGGAPAPPPVVSAGTSGTPAYQVWILDDDYTKATFLPNAGSAKTWSRLDYHLQLNEVDSCILELLPNATAISSLDVGKRLLVLRNGSVVFVGMIVRLRWQIEETAPEGDTYTVTALGGAIYADWRLAIPGAGDEYDERTDHADDLAKDYVYYHCAGGAAAARQFSDLTVAADLHGATSITEQARYDRVLTLIQRLADKQAFQFRFVPSASGYTFTTAAPYWGVNRTEGNGAQDEVIWSLDRRNITSATWDLDTTGHRNYLYVAGQGEGADRTIVERSTAGDITAHKRRELLYDQRQLQLAASLQNAGDAKLAELSVGDMLRAQPLTSRFDGSWDLGDRVTIYVRRYGRTYSANVQITALDVVVENDVETVMPTVEEV